MDLKSCFPGILVGSLALAALTLGQAPSPPLSDEQVEARVEELLSRMTLEEKVGQLAQIPGGLFPGAKPEEAVRKGGAGSVLWLNDTRKFNELQKVAVDESRLGIPLLFALDVIHGYKTIFPVPLGMAASWDPEMVENAQAVAAREARAAGIHWTFGPMVDIARDARWGRIVEGAGEDPYLGAVMATAHVRGFQGPYLGAPEHVIACAKHFAGYGAADGGRDYDPAYLPEGLLRNVHLPPFHAAVKAGVGTVMSAYMDLNDVPATANPFLLRQVLRQEWGFKGFVVSDAMSVGNLLIQGFARDRRDAALRALSAGLDMDMASNIYAENLAALVEDGELPVARIDGAVRPILAAKFRLGLFENPYADEARLQEVLQDPDSRRQARLAAQRSMVLLRNEGGLLPLRKDLRSLAVIGPVADSREDMEGSWIPFGQKAGAVTIVEGIRSKLGAGARVEYAKGPDIKRDSPSMFEIFLPGSRKPTQTPEEADTALAEAVATARRADTVVMVLGELANMSGEGASRASLDLPGRQQELLETIVALGKPIVLVLVNGRPLSIGWAAQHVPAILEAWHPGSEGGHAVADILFGDANPGGKLPATFPRSAAHAPLYYARNLTHSPEEAERYLPRYWDGAPEPLFPFGFGLSYTTFSFSSLQLESSQVQLGARAGISVEVENTGPVKGDEVVQLYIHQRSGSDSRPRRELKGFRRIALEPGQKQIVRFELGPEELAYWSTSQGKRIQEPASYDIWVGADSTANLHGELTVVP